MSLLCLAVESFELGSAEVGGGGRLRTLTAKVRLLGGEGDADERKSERIILRSFEED